MFTYRHRQRRILRNKNKLTLTDLEIGQTGNIILIAGGRMAAKRLADLGLTPGTEIKVLRKALFSGPIVIEACGSKLVIGQGLASKIFVGLK